MFEKVKNILASSHLEGKANKKSNNTIALEVLLGKWGSGKTRKTKLTKAGYNYNAIQKIVNDRMTKKSIDTVAKEVIDAKWGSGKTRKKCLTIAGYNYNTVQNKVNEILTGKTRQDKMCEWAKKIADSGQYHYKRWKAGDKKTQQCPICHNLTGQYKGWNCIGYAWASWHHSGLNTTCTCGVISNDTAEKILRAKTDADAKKIAEKHIGTSDIKVIRNKSGIAASSLKKGDVVLYFKGDTYFHTVLYVGNGKVAESNTTNPNITYGKVSYHKNYGKVAIRYTGK